MHLAKHAWILSITVNKNDNYCQRLDGWVGCSWCGIEKGRLDQECDSVLK